MSVEANTAVATGQLAYMWVPADQLRGFADGLFPYLAKCPLADVAQGAGHRFKAGHDLFVDIPRTFADHGIGDAAHQTGHIVLTDFPTKAGIPIPGLSHTGLGEWLVNAGIPKGWLSFNLWDAGLAIIAVPEGASDLLNAIAGTLSMNTATFFDTFGEGSTELVLAFALPVNPLPLLIAGVANVLAGVVATVNTVLIHVDPVTFFGSSLTSALVGFVVGKGIARKSVSESAQLALRGGTIGALFAVSPFFGFGAIGAFLAFKGGQALRDHHREMEEGAFDVSKESAEMFLEEARKLSPWIDSMLGAAHQTLLSADVSTLSAGIVPQLRAELHVLPSEVTLLDATCEKLEIPVPLLRADAPELRSIFEAFEDVLLPEPPRLAT